MEIRTGEILPEVLTATFSQYGPTMFGKFVLLIHIFTFSASFSLSPPLVLAYEARNLKFRTAC